MPVQLGSTFQRAAHRVAGARQREFLLLDYSNGHNHPASACQPETPYRRETKAQGEVWRAHIAGKHQGCCLVRINIPGKPRSGRKAWHVPGKQHRLWVDDQWMCREWIHLSKP